MKKLLFAAAMLLVVLTASAQNSANSWRALLSKMLANATVQLEDGGVHFGNTDQPGLVLQYYADGSLYCGEFMDDADGFSTGMMIPPDGSEIGDCPGAWVYIGGFSNGLKSGDGLLFDSNGTLIYAGTFKDNKPMDSYPVDYSDVLSISFAVSELDDGSIYVGMLDTGVSKGLGLYLWPSGDAWYGSWQNGLQNGEGIQIHNDGTFLLGTWQDGELVTEVEIDINSLSWEERLSLVTANAPIKYDDGGVHIGDTVDGYCFHSWGENNSGGWYSGEIKNGKRHGFGIYVVMDENSHIDNCPGGWVYWGYWINDMYDGYDGRVFDRSGKVIYRGGFVNGKPFSEYPSPKKTLKSIKKYTFEIDNKDGNIFIGVISEEEKKKSRGKKYGYKWKFMSGVYLMNDGDAWFGSWHLSPDKGVYLKSNGDYATGVYSKMKEWIGSK